MIRYKQNKDLDILSQIIDLQAENLKTALDISTAQNQGFLTLKHTIEHLELICDDFGHTIALDEKGQLVGYALVMLENYRSEFPEIKFHFEVIDSIIPNDKTYMVMGQICIQKNQRGKGIFRGLYDFQKMKMSNSFDYIVTIISKFNFRSVRAHEKVGFKTIHRSDNWVIVSLSL